MIEFFMTLLGSSGFGAIIGSATGLAKIFMEQRNKKMDQDHEKDRWKHELEAKAKDIEYAQAEAQGRKDVAIVEGQSMIESAAYGAMAKAYEQDKLSSEAWDVAKSSKFARVVFVVIEAAQKLVRPVLTYALTGTALYMNFWLIKYVNQMWPMLLPDQRFDMVMKVFAWTLFQASTVIGYWFVNRPSSMK